jgi:hypothetical protein
MLSVQLKRPLKEILMSTDKKQSYTDSMEDVLREALLVHGMYQSARTLWSEVSTSQAIAQHPNGPELLVALSALGNELRNSYQNLVKKYLNGGEDPEWLDLPFK